MPLYDLPEPALSAYRSAAVPPADLDAFWERTLAEARCARRPMSLAPVDTGLELVSTLDVTFSGFGGDPVRAWYHRPAWTAAELPLVVRFQGYGNGRGAPHDVGPWALAGYACLEVDTRGRGCGSSGLLTCGITEPDTYHYRRVFTDAVLAVEAGAELPGVDRARVAVGGVSQGGGIALAVAALSPLVAFVMADVPFLSDFRRGAEIASAAPYAELARYLAAHPERVEETFATLAYFDVSVLVRAAFGRALFSVALMDEVCPPSTVYAAYNAYAGPKQIRSHPFGGHEDGRAEQRADQLRRLADQLPATARVDCRVSRGRARPR